MDSIVKNQLINPNEKKTLSYSDYLKSYRDVENDTHEQQTVVHDLQTLIDGMTPEVRDVIKLRIKGMGYDEIAKELNLPISTVKNRVSDARIRIKTVLNK